MPGKTMNIDDASRDQTDAAGSSKAAFSFASVEEMQAYMLKHGLQPDPLKDVMRGAGTGTVTSTRPPDNAAAIGMPETVRIVLEDNDSVAPNGQPFGINGKAYILMPGVPADVPQGLIDVLDNAEQVVPRIDPLTKRVVGHHVRKRFSYRRLSPEG